MHALFSDSFIAGIARLKLNIRAAAPRSTAGSHLSHAAGASLTFRDYQAYAPGDDLRRVDWSVYGRTRHLFVRRFEQPTAVPFFVLVDASRSMTLEMPTRYATAARLAAAISSAVLAGHNPLRLVVADGRAITPRAVSGRRGLVHVLSELSTEGVAATTGPAAAIRAITPALAHQGSGVLVVISDFFEDSGVDVLVDVLRMVPHRLVMLRVTQPWDAEPNLSGDLELENCETNTRLQISAEADVLDRYRKTYRDYFDTLDHYATMRGATTAQFDASADTLPQLERLFRGGVLSL